jgi:hypothetical protein
MTKNKINVNRFLRNCVVITVISIVVSNIVDFWLGIMDTLFLMVPIVIFFMIYSYSELQDNYVEENLLDLLSFVISILIVTIISDFILIFYFISIKYHIITYLIPSIIDSILIIYILISKKKIKNFLDEY